MGELGTLAQDLAGGVAEAGAVTAASSRAIASASTASSVARRRFRVRGVRDGVGGHGDRPVCSSGRHRWKAERTHG